MLRLSFLGCGWLGKAFVTKFSSLYRINAGVRSYESYLALHTYKCQAFHLPQNQDRFYECDVLVISLSPRHDYINALGKILASLNADVHVILLSSTSVYHGLEGRVSDSSLPKDLHASKALTMEQYIQERVPNCTTLRLGGLMGPDRVAGQWKDMTKRIEDTPVNYLHQEDAIHVIHYVITNQISGVILNVVAPEHPLRSVVYKRNNAPILTQHTQSSTTRYIQSDKLIKDYGYQFVHPNPLEFWT